MKRAVITGGAGFLGSNIAKVMSEKGYGVFASYHSGKPEHPIENVTYVKADLLDPLQCDSLLEGKDILIMCAAYVGGIADMQKNPHALINNNTRININTLEAAYKNKIKKCIFISSGAIYPELKGPAGENDAFTGDPIDKYYILGWSKRFAEILCRIYSQKMGSTMDTTVLRIDNVYGPYDTFEGDKAHVVPSLVRKVVSGDNPIVVWGDGEEKKDFLYVEDLAKAVYLAVENCCGFHEYNVARGKNNSINQVLDILLEINGCREKAIEHDLAKPSSISERNLNTGKIREELGFQAETGIREGLEKTVQWYKKYGMNGEEYGYHKNPL